MKEYFITIGLEVHAELKTSTKMFCSCKNDPDETKPNTNICHVCMAHPGALPVINKKAVENVIKVGLAIDGEIADFTEFDRKNYFYPDIPKGFQISQYKYPIVSGGHLADFDITRIHLEEDTGTNKHPSRDAVRAGEEEHSLVDFNRAGVPLMELVTEAHTFETAEAAGQAALKFTKELQLVLQYLGVSEANMEKGEMRVEANVSISPEKEKMSKTYVEVKNLNSFRAAERAIIYEAKRMKDLWDEGREGEIAQETRGWDEGKQKTFSQRAKESSHDYRYFPEPDLPKMKLHEAFDLKGMKNELGELPSTKRERYEKEYGIKSEDIESYVNDLKLATWFEKVAEILKEKDQIKTASNYITSDLLGLEKAGLSEKRPEAANFALLIQMLNDSKVSSRGAKDVLAMMVKKDESPEVIAKREDLIQKNDEGALTLMIEKVINENESVVADYKGGKEAAIMSLVGRVMKESRGSANPQLVLKLLKDKLG